MQIDFDVTRWPLAIWNIRLRSIAQSGQKHRFDIDICCATVWYALDMHKRWEAIIFVGDWNRIFAATTTKKEFFLCRIIEFWICYDVFNWRSTLLPPPFTSFAFYYDKVVGADLSNSNFQSHFPLKKSQRAISILTHRWNYIFIWHRHGRLKLTIHQRNFVIGKRARKNYGSCNSIKQVHSAQCTLILFNW